MTLADDALVEVPPDRWDDALAAAGVTDVYYSRGYVQASALLVGGTATLLHLPGHDGDVLFACVVRRDPIDVVTPYGYGGPLATGADPPVDAFAARYEDWCAARRALTSFAVFHPLAQNAAYGARAGFRLTELSGTVAWALERPDLLANMHRHHRRVVRRALAGGCEVAIDPVPTDLTAFVTVYEETMRRQGASPFYLFADAYWRALVNGVPLVQVDVHRGGERIASVLGMGAPPWLHYHLGAVADAGRGTGASHLALYSLAEWGRENGFTTLHLGGGVGGRADSLLDFKLRFAPKGLVPAAIGKAVHDPAAYRALTGTDAIDWDAFFPAYRRPY